MLQANTFLTPYRIRLHRKRFAQALELSRYQYWRVEDSARREFVYDIFVKLYRTFPSPLDCFHDSEAFLEYLDAEFKKTAAILDNHRKICGADCKCLNRKPGGDFHYI